MEVAWQEQEPRQQRTKRQKIKAWLGERFSVRNDRDTFITRIGTGSTALFSSLSMLTAVLGMPTGFGTVIDVIVFLTVNAAVMSIASILISFLLSLLYIPLPRRFAAVWIYVCVQTYLILYFAELGILMSILIALAFTLTGALAGGLLGLLLALRLRSRSKAVFALAVACAVSVFYVYVDLPGPAAIPHRAAVPAGSVEAAVQAIQADNPAEHGSFPFQAFSYGSGLDKHRALFGDQVDIQTTAVDASGYITKWSGLKTFFWGFDEHALPLNGRVWMPDGEGPFPLVLIVHGNHLMEDFSDSGYGYLGELLASKGIIAVSVDENFLNYSVWSGIPNNDMKVRAWVLLKHLQQIKQLNDQPDTLFTGKVDLANVALIGHSRGGQAVAMAADPDKWFKEDKTLDSLENVHIESVVAIAPTDKQVDDKSARLLDVNYLTLQGSRDADVNNFYGDRQYSRASFRRQSDQFKAALYIGDANHSQFNSAWGRMDERPPGGLFLNLKGMLKEEEQRQISKVYAAAFLQATLLGQEEYRMLFRDHRSGLSWLPDTDYMSRYEEAGFTEITRYEEDSRKTTLKNGGTAAAVGMKTWEESYAKDRDGKSKGTKGIELEWTKPGASYELELSPEMNNADDLTEDKSIVFSMANLERDLIPADAEGTELQDEESVELPPLPEVEIELTINDGEKLIAELADVMPVPSSMYSSFTSLAWLEQRMKDKKYKESTEPVFQTYVLPIEVFSSEGVTITADNIKGITFRFLNGPGKVMLDDIGFMP